VIFIRSASAIRKADIMRRTRQSLAPMAPAADFTIPMSVLIGDTNANRKVNAADVSQVKSRLGQTVDATNFPSDVHANGNINAADETIIKSNLGSGLP
jgi:Dockerin type I domain